MNPELWAEVADLLVAPDGSKPLMTQTHWPSGFSHEDCLGGKVCYRSFPLYQGDCAGAGWVPIYPSLQHLMAAATRCGIIVRIDRFMVYANDPNKGFEAKSYYNPTDPDAILEAAIKAVLEVVR